MLGKLKNLLNNDIGIDLGTANTLITVRGEGIVLREPSVVAINKATDKPEAVGLEAKRMLGRTPGRIEAIRPLKEGVIADYDITEVMLRHFIKKVSSRRRIAPPKVLVAVPSGITEVESRAVRESALRAGAREVHLIEEPMAAAIGVGMPIAEPVGNMIVDVGGGTTEIAVISLAGIVSKTSLRIGGDEMDRSISNYIKGKYSLKIGERTAENIKLTIGSAFSLGDDETTMEISGFNQANALPKAMTIGSEEIREALTETIQKIIVAIRQTLEKCPPELAADLLNQGIIIAGGGALLPGIDKLISQETGLPVSIAEDPLLAVVLGTEKVLDDMKLLSSTVSSTKHKKVR